MGDVLVCVIFYEKGNAYYTSKDCLSFEKKYNKIGLYVKCLPQRGDCSCCSKRNISANPDLSCYRGVICSFVVYHFDISKIRIFIKDKSFNHVFANI